MIKVEITLDFMTDKFVWRYLSISALFRSPEYIRMSALFIK